MEKSTDNVFMKIVKYLIPWKGDRVSEIIRKIIFLCAVIVLIVTGSIFISQKVNAGYEQRVKEEITKQFHGGGVTIDTAKKEEIQKKYPEVQDKFLALLADEKNVRADDIAGWLTVGNSDKNSVDEIVMQCEDNDYYLSHDLRGAYARSGMLFADYRNKLTADEVSANIIIYGHNMANPNIDHFGKLTRYFNYAFENNKNDISYYKNNPTLTFSTLYDTNVYKIFAGIMVNTSSVAGEVFKYHNVHNFANKAAFDDYAAKILDRSCFITPDVDLRYGDELITLSTCILNYGEGAEARFVLFARKVREGESPEVDVSKAFPNPSPLFYDLYYKTFGGKWEGRQWPEEIIWGYKKEEN